MIRALIIVGLTVSAGICVPSVNFAQSSGYKIEHISSEGGLPATSVNDIHEDRLGFLWLATDGGLVRYDGVEYKSYRHIEGDTMSLSGNNVHQIQEDAAGNFWLATDEGVSYFDHRKEEIENFELGTIYAISSSSLDPDRLWVASPAGLGQLVIPSRQFEIMVSNELAYPAPSIFFFNNGLHGLIEDASGKVWAGMSWGILRYDPEARSVKRFFPDERFPDYLPEESPANLINAVGSLLRGKDENYIWVSSRGGLLRFDLITEQFETYFPPGETCLEPYFRGLHEGASGTFWASTRCGLFKLYPGHSELTQIYEINSNSSAIYEDRNGTVWVGHGDGLRKAVPPAYPFKIYEGIESGGKGISETREGKVVFESERGLIEIDPINESEPKLIEIEEMERSEFGLVLSMATDMHDNLWVARALRALEKYNLSTKTYELVSFYEGKENSIGGGNPNHILEDDKGILWIGLFGGGLNRFDPDTGDFTRYRHDPADSTSLASNNVFRLYTSPSRPRELWLATGAGPTRFDIENESFTNFQDESVGTATALHEDEEGRLWVTSFNGLHLLNPDTGVFTTYSTAEGLAHESIWSVLADEGGYLWLGTLNGLSRFDPNSKTFRTFTTKEGLPANRFREHGFFKSSSGALFFNAGRREEGTWVSFFPDQLNDEEPPPEIALTRFDIAGETVNPGKESPLNQSIVFTNSIALNHDENELTFQYSGLGARDPEGIQFQHMLEGFDENWVDDGVQRSVRYNRLPPGEYTFLVRGSTSRSTWSTPRSLDVAIHPPWWKTGIAYFIYAVLLVGGLVTFDRIQRRRLVAKERQQAQIREAKLEAEAAQALSREATAMTRALEEENKRKEVELEKAEELRQAHAALETSYEDLQQTHTRLQETQEQLIHAEKMASLGQLTAGIAHEIKNPLNFVNNFSQLSLGMMEELRHFLQQLHGRIPVSALPNPGQPASEEGGVQADHDQMPERLGTGQTRGSAPNRAAPSGAAENDGSASMWEEALETIEILMMNAERIAHHGQRADGIVRAMIEHSRTGPGERRPVDLNQLLDEHVQLAYHGMQAREEGFAVELVRDYDEAIGEVEVVPQELGRVFINLLNNAFDAVRVKAQIETDHVPRVHIQTVHRENGIEVRIEDNGMGIPDQVRDRVFQPFYTTKPAGSGSTGLGLSLSHDIVVKGHGGSLGVESEEGKGATFTLALPA